jgi:hypothetical protein
MGLPEAFLMALRIVSLEDKLAALELVLDRARTGYRPPGSDAQRHYEALKALGSDLRARIEFPRSNALGELTRALERMIESKVRHYDDIRMIHVANVLINKWPTVSQALERFGEESAE